jgi:hypothetical protein
MQHRHDLQWMLKQHIADYDKHVRFSDLEKGYSDAVRRELRLDGDAEQAHEEGRNPMTGFWRLTEKIRTSV